MKIFYLKMPEKDPPMRWKKPRCSGFFGPSIGSLVADEPLPPDAPRAGDSMANPSRLQSGPVEHSIDFPGENQCGIQLLVRLDRL